MFFINWLIWTSKSRVGHVAIFLNILLLLDSAPILSLFIESGHPVLLRELFRFLDFGYLGSCMCSILAIVSQPITFLRSSRSFYVQIFLFLINFLFQLVDSLDLPLPFLLLKDLELSLPVFLLYYESVFVQAIDQMFAHLLV